MSREPHIPLFLWIATALLLHVTGGEGAQQVATVLGERMEMQRFADAVRKQVRSAQSPMEVALVDPDTLAPAEPVEPQKPEEDADAPPEKSDPNATPVEKTRD